VGKIYWTIIFPRENYRKAAMTSHFGAGKTSQRKLSLAVVFSALKWLVT
jgi:hypothetical protein